MAKLEFKPKAKVYLFTNINANFNHQDTALATLLKYTRTTKPNTVFYICSTMYCH